METSRIEAAESQIVETAKRIDFYTAEYTVELLATKVAAEEYVVPNYQRQFTWEQKRKARFIESLIMGLPIPFLFFWEMEDGRLEIVDGSQRLRTIEEYIRGDLVLTELEELTCLNGLRFTDLLASRQRKIKNKSIRGIILGEHADKETRFDMFDRINTGSKNANRAEIRRGALQGPFMQLIADLAELDLLHNLAPMSAKLKAERGYDELVTRFFAYSDGIDSYRDKPAEFLFKYVDEKNRVMSENSDLAGEYRDRFVDMLTFVERVFPYGFRKSERGNATPRNRFDSIAVGAYLASRKQPGIYQSDADTLKIEEWLESKDFEEIVTSGSSNTKAKLTGRLNFVRDRLLEAVNA